MGRLLRGSSVVNVGVFAAVGKEHLAGQTFEADERQDELTFASLSGSATTLYDLRQIRPMLHAIPAVKRTPLETNLIYWADSYDYVLCYPTVSPLLDSSADPRRRPRGWDGRLVRGNALLERRPLVPKS